MITRLYVHNYRCLQNFELNLSGQSSALLIGRNGAGKSTVLRALQVLQMIARGPNRAQNVVDDNDFSHHRTDQPMRFEAELLIQSQRFKYAVSFDWPSEFWEARILGESLHREGVAVFTRDNGQVTMPDGQAFGIDWHVFALPVISEKPPAKSIQTVKAFFAGMMLLSPIPATMGGYAAEPSTELDFHATNFAACLLAMLQQKPRAYATFEAFVRRVVPDFSSIENVERGRDGGSQLTVTFEDKGKSPAGIFDFDELSDGEKCFLLAAYVVSANVVWPGVVCLWDEPDNHLSLSQVGHFIMALRKMTNSGGQFICTTHHPETVRKFASENTFVFTRRSHQEPTVVRTLADIPYSGDLIHALVRDEIIG